MPDQHQNPRTLALVGMPGAGKTLCAKHLEEQGFYQFRFGSIIVDEVVKRGWDINPENERVVREAFRKQDGMDAIAKRALPKLKAALAERACIIIDGLYSFAEYKTLRQELGEDMVVVAIVAARRLRYERLAKRAIRPLTAAEAQERDWQEIEKIEKGGPIAIADYTLVNDGSPEKLLQQLDALLEKLGMTGS
jgi:dephospho-CoA kinase